MDLSTNSSIVTMESIIVRFFKNKSILRSIILIKTRPEIHSRQNKHSVKHTVEPHTVRTNTSKVLLLLL